MTQDNELKKVQESGEGTIKNGLERQNDILEPRKSADNIVLQPRTNSQQERANGGDHLIEIGTEPQLQPQSRSKIQIVDKYCCD